GLYVQGKPAFFDLYIYRDAYTEIPAAHTANALGINVTTSDLRSINNDDWAMYAGVEFGGDDYPIIPDSVEISASSASSGGTVEVWLDSIDTGKKIAECNIENTGGSTTYKVFSAKLDSVSGRHDVYLKFLGTGTQDLFRIRWFKFLGRYNPATSVEDVAAANAPRFFALKQNHPNPFNPSTKISYVIPKPAWVTLKIYDLLGREIQTLIDEFQQLNTYEVNFDASKLASGIYFYRLQAGNAFTATKKMLFLK
ncbi:carbohydrate-binding protein, partial [bacterium]|nr:carbohydrate-binding protein [bacterium]